MRIALFGLLAATTALGGCSDYGDRPYPGYGPGPSDYSRYDYDRPDPRYNGYYADQYYRDDPRYQERVLSRDDRVYAGRDGRYYCRRSDGTTGLIVGGIAGGVLGGALTSGHAEPLGILLGAIAGGATGAAIDKDNVRCR